jgi:hypothetical protein
LGALQLLMNFTARKAKDTPPCTLFRGLRFAGVIPASEQCDSDNAKIASTLWDAFKGPLGDRTWAANAGNPAQIKSLIALFERSEGDGLIDIATIFALHRKWPLQPTAGLTGPTIVEAMNERLALLGESSHGSFGLTSYKAGTRLDAKANEFTTKWKELVSTLGLPTAAGKGDANRHVAARSLIRYQLKFLDDPSSVKGVDDAIGAMNEAAASLLSLALQDVEAELAKVAAKANAQKNP